MDHCALKSKKSAISGSCSVFTQSKKSNLFVWNFFEGSSSEVAALQSQEKISKNPVDFKPSSFNHKTTPVHTFVISAFPNL